MNKKNTEKKIKQEKEDLARLMHQAGKSRSKTAGALWNEDGTLNRAKMKEKAEHIIRNSPEMEDEVKEKLRDYMDEKLDQLEALDMLRENPTLITNPDMKRKFPDAILEYL